MFAYAAVVATLVALAHGQCSVDFHSKLKTPEPVFLRKNNNQIVLWVPNGPLLQWHAGEATLIACPGNKIKLGDVKTETVTAYIQCVSGTLFKIGEQPVDISEVTCIERSTGTHQNTRQACGNGGSGTLLNLGFDIPNVGFITYIQSCYNMQTASVIYTRHTIHGTAIKCESQALKYLFSNNLERGHLTPDADGILRQWQWVTYFYVNAAPQWKTINNGNWKLVEEIARYLADRLREELIIYTGAHGILTLPDVNGHQVRIKLEEGGIEVPKWFWKIIWSKNTNRAIAFVTDNNPFTDMPEGEKLCTTDSEHYGWVNFPGWKKYNDGNKLDRGFTYCCTVPVLRLAISDIPDEFRMVDVLRY
uniref:DNA/RNA non-specific endonuclease domain-containing protein n=1 Tax=Anopheles dirus TaxID=7168 RepID=A0A182N2I3_9DIPT